MKGPTPICIDDAIWHEKIERVEEARRGDTGSQATIGSYQIKHSSFSLVFLSVFSSGFLSLLSEIMDLLQSVIGCTPLS